MEPCRAVELFRILQQPKKIRSMRMNSLFSPSHRAGSLPDCPQSVYQRELFPPLLPDPSFALLTSPPPAPLNCCLSFFQTSISSSVTSSSLTSPTSSSIHSLISSSACKHSLRLRPPTSPLCQPYRLRYELRYKSRSSVGILVH